MTNTNTLSRAAAIETLAKHEMTSKDDRADSLGHLHSNYDWNGDLSQQITYSWDETHKKHMPDSEPNIVFQKIVDSGLSDVFITGKFGDPSDSKYDDILIEYAKEDFQFWNNDQLLEALDALGHKTRRLIGTLKLYACPCCGANSLTERGEWDICPICWWEDDGTDNEEASLYFSGPNNGLQLTAARINFIEHGIYNPDRKDLLEKALPLKLFDLTRIFKIDSQNGRIFETSTNWQAPLKPPHLNEGEGLPKVSLAGAALRDWPPLDE
ncbi:MAG: CPCC family cysteine-rich protein [Hellea sp.]